MALLDFKVTVRPLAGAALLIVTVAVDGLPPTTVVGFKEIPVTVGAVMFRLAVFEIAPRVPVMFAVAFAATATVVTVNVAVFDPEATVTEPGTVALALSEASVTT